MGCLGGLLNAYLTDKGFVSPRWERLGEGEKIWRPGWLGNMFVGGFAALVIWGLYGPLSVVPVVGNDANTQVILTFGSMAAAVVTGIGGSRVLMSELEKRVDESSRQKIQKGLTGRLRRLEEQLEALTDAEEV